ncbi:MAG: hypothetical protein HFH91_08750 [Lachnospiraceae bacterium]|nr:hypothetical protein [Lachnospiraceae bacterium]
MKKYAWLMPKMAITNIRKNGSVYFPYIGVSIFAIFTYFVFDLILKNDIMYHLPKGMYTLILIEIGFVLLGLIMVPFLYYTNSFLIKRRKRELGLYSILGLEKKHIGIMMFWESAIMYLIVTAAAIAFGLLFSRLIFLLLLNLAKMPVNVEFTISPLAIRDTMIFYAFVMGLNLFVNLVQVGRANPVELMSDSRRGEKEPKRIGLWSLIGLAALGTGYWLALKARLESSVFTDFFLAVFLVILGTYYLFTSGSIAVLRLCRRKKKFYYRPENFITVSGMLYRMKKSAASLSNICVFSTMVIITVVCTVTVYLGMDAILTSNFTREFEIILCGQEKARGSEVKEETARLAAEYGVALEEELDYSCVEARVWQEGNAFVPEDAQGRNYGWKRLKMMTLEEFNLLEGTEETLPPGEVLVYSVGIDFGYGSISFAGEEYSVKRELTKSRVEEKHSDDTFANVYLVVFADREELRRAASGYGADAYGGTWYYGFQPEGEAEALDAFSGELGRYAASLSGFAGYEDHREQEKLDEGLYGGLLFVGIFFGSIFLICLLIIMYYKQITEGFEDQKNFEIMQKVGMGDEEIRRTIRKQISMVFGLPLAGAILHTAVGMRMVYMLLGSIGFFEKMLLIGCTGAGCLVFALVYGFSYRRSSMAYYRIVRHL